MRKNYFKDIRTEILIANAEVMQYHSKGGNQETPKARPKEH
jgi:hypothetical protein